MDAHRQACQRQHRVLGHFLAIQSWLRGIDCIAIERDDLKSFLGLMKLEQVRVEWVLEDLSPWFPFNNVYELSGAAQSLHSIYFSRLEIESFLNQNAKTMPSEARIKALPVGAPKTQLFFSNPKNNLVRLTEIDVVKYLAILDSGLSLPTVLMGMSKN